MRRELKVCITDAAPSRMPALIDHQGNYLNDRPDCIINVVPLLWQETLRKHGNFFSRIEILTITLVIFQIIPGKCLRSATGNANGVSAVLCGRSNVYTMCFLLTKSFCYILARNLIVAVMNHHIPNQTEEWPPTNYHYNHYNLEIW